MIEVGYALNKGFKRRGKNNQDSLGVLLPDKNSLQRLPLLIVADGMGGYSGGELASQMVVQSIEKAYRKLWRKKSVGTGILVKGVFNAHKAMRRKARRKSELSRMGSTVVAVIVDLLEGQAHVVNVGDSRLYRINDEAIEVISFDHSRVAEKVREGILSEEDAENDPQKNILTMSISAKRNADEITPHIGSYPFVAGDVLLLCSDGLWGTLPNTVMQAVSLELAPEKAAKKLVELANARGGPDNISVIVARRQGEALDRDDGDETNPGFPLVS